MSDKPFKHYDLHAVYCALTWRHFDFAMEVIDLDRSSLAEHQLWESGRDDTDCWCFSYSEWMSAPGVPPHTVIPYATEDDMQLAMDGLANGINEHYAQLSHVPYGGLLGQFQHYDQPNRLLIEFRFTKR